MKDKDIEGFKNLVFDSVNYCYNKRKNRSRYTVVHKGITPKKILLKDSPYIITANSKTGSIEVLKNCSVYVEGDKICSVFNADKNVVEDKDVDLVYDAAARGGIVLTPGFVNVHSHPTMYLMRSAMLLDYGQHLDETIAKMPLWQQFIEGQSAIISTLGDLTEQQKAGITTTLNHNALFDEVDKAAQACNQRIVNCVSAISNSRPDVTLETAIEYIKAKKRAMSQGGIAIHYLYKTNEDLLARIYAAQQKYQVLVTIHFAESHSVAQKCVEKFGMRETRLLEKYKLLNPLTLLSHVLHVTDDEIRILINSKVGIAHLPTSNALHKSGVFKYIKFAEYGGAERIALGTDSVVSKSKLDMLTEAFQTRITHLPDYTVYYEDLFKMLTVNAGRVLNMPYTGCIEPGFKADISFWKLKDRGFLPYDMDNPLTLVGNIISHGGRNIRDLMVNGVFTISNRVHNFVNESEMLIDIQEQHMYVRNKVKEVK